MKASIPLQRLEQAAREAGCTVKPMASYTLITRGTSKNCLFVHKTKNVSAIDVGGFDIPGDRLAQNLGGLSHGSVRQVLRNDLSDAAFFANFREVCQKLDTYPPREKAPRARPVGLPGTKHKEPGSVVVVSSSETPQQTIERLQAKIALIRRVSQEKGIPVSKKTEREITEQIEKAQREIRGEV